MPFARGVHGVAEAARLGIEIGVVGERAPGQEVVLEEVHGPLDARRAVRIALLVRAEDKAAAFGEGRHLGCRDHPRAGARGDHDVRVINHAGGGGPAEVLERVGQEDLAGKPRETGIALDEEHPRVAQHAHRGLDAVRPAPDRGAVGRGIVLHLLPGREVIVPGRHRRSVAEAMAPAIGGQRRIGEGGALGDQLLVDADQIAAAALDQLQDLLVVRLGLLSAFNPWHRRAAGLEHRPDRAPGDLEGPSNLADAVALRP